jgi:hypothetical protein
MFLVMAASGDSRFPKIGVSGNEAVDYSAAY